MSKEGIPFTDEELAEAREAFTDGYIDGRDSELPLEPLSEDELYSEEELEDAIAAEIEEEALEDEGENL